MLEREKRGKSPEEETLGFLGGILSTIANFASGAGNEARDFVRGVNETRKQLGNQIGTGVNFGAQVAGSGIEAAGHVAKFVAEKSRQINYSEKTNIIAGFMGFGLATSLIGLAVVSNIRDTSPKQTTLTEQEAHEIARLVAFSREIILEDGKNDEKLRMFEQELETLYYLIFGVTGVGGAAFFITFRSRREKIAIFIALAAVLIDILIYSKVTNHPTNQELEEALQLQEALEQLAEEHRDEITRLTDALFGTNKEVQLGDGTILRKKDFDTLRKRLKQVHKN